jgi:O-antigen ligase
MWLPGYPSYTIENRLTGTYFCPDHFAGIMEIALCLSLGILLARDAAWMRKAFAAILGCLALIIVVLSKSRGGGLTVVVVAMGVLGWGFLQWPSRARWGWRLSVVSLMALGLMAFCSMETRYVTRFKEHFGGSQLSGKSFVERCAVIEQALRSSCRGKMYGGALRAWHTRPMLGIGPGMHQNLWPHFAPSPDGNREWGVWPSTPNYDFHSYEVHSDWIQLIEEYGLIGVILFLIPIVFVFGPLFRGLYEEKTHWEKHDWRWKSSPHIASVMGAVLAGLAMAFHSLGDFNLQMPATVWLLAAVVALPLAEILRVPEPN